MQIDGDAQLLDDLCVERVLFEVLWREEGLSVSRNASVVRRVDGSVEGHAERPGVGLLVRVEEGDILRLHGLSWQFKKGSVRC